MNSRKNSSPQGAANKNSAPAQPAVASIAGHGVNDSDGRSAEIVLFLLELACTTSDRSLMEVAKCGADHLAATWKDFALKNKPIRSETDSLFNYHLSRFALALAEAWKMTHHIVYRDAGLGILQYLDEILPAPHSDADSCGGAKR